MKNLTKNSLGADFRASPEGVRRREAPNKPKDMAAIFHYAILINILHSTLPLNPRIQDHVTAIAH